MAYSLTIALFEKASGPVIKYWYFLESVSSHLSIHLLGDQKLRLGKSGKEVDGRWVMMGL